MTEKELIAAVKLNMKIGKKYKLRKEVRRPEIEILTKTMKCKEFSKHTVIFQDATGRTTAFNYADAYKILIGQTLT